MDAGVNVALRIDADADRRIARRVAVVRGVADDRIDHQRACTIVAADDEGDSPAVEPERSRNQHAAGRAVLVDEELVHAQARLPAAGDEVFAVQPQRVRTAHLETDERRIGAGRDHEVELRLALAAVEDEIDAGIDAAVDHPPVHRHVAAPRARIGTGVVVRLAGQHVLGHDGRRGTTLDPAQPDRLGVAGARRGEARFATRQPQAIASGLADVAHVVGRLTAIRLEGQGQTRQAQARRALGLVGDDGGGGRAGGGRGGPESERHGEKARRRDTGHSTHLAHVRCQQ